MAGSETRKAQLERAHRRLLEKHLLSAEDDAVSVLLPSSRRMLFRAKSDAEASELPLDGGSGIAALHAQVYRLRPDAGAVASVTTATSAALRQNRVRVPIVFDEQARHIGEAWSNTAPSALASVLGSGANAGVVDGRFLLVGVTPNRMVYNAELFEKSAHAYLLARGNTGRRTHLVPWWVRLIAGRRLRRDQQNAAARHAAGNEAKELVAY